MTVSTTANRIQYSGNGAITSFAFPYKFFKTAEITVVLSDSTSTVTQTLGSDYSISGTITDGIYESGANIVFTTAPATGKTVTIYRAIELKQETNYVENDAFPAKTHEQALDRLTLIVQQLNDAISRALLLPNTSALSGLRVPSPEALKYLGWNAAATNLENKDVISPTVALPSFGGNALNLARVNSLANNLEYITPAAVRIALGARTNAGNPNGSLTGNFQGEWLYDTTNNIAYIYSGSTTVWYPQQSAKNSLLALPTNYHDVKIVYKNANTVTIKAGSRVRSSDDTTDIILSADTDCALNVSGLNGLDTGSEAISTWYYLYQIINTTTGAVGFVFSAVNESITGSITLPSGYTKKRQLRFAVRNDASSNILPFVCPTQGRIIYTVPQVVLAGGGSVGYTAISCAAQIPPISRLGQFNIYGSISGTDNRARTTGQTNVMYLGFVGGGINVNTNTFFELPTDGSQQIDYTTTSGGATNYAVSGYTITEIA